MLRSSKKNRRRSMVDTKAERAEFEKENAVPEEVRCSQHPPSLPTGNASAHEGSRQERVGVGWGAVPRAMLCRPLNGNLSNEKNSSPLEQKAPSKEFAEETGAPPNARPTIRAHAAARIQPPCNTRPCNYVRALTPQLIPYPLLPFL